MGRSRAKHRHGGGHAAGRAIVVVATVLVLVAYGCGDDGRGDTDSEKESDIATLNSALARELAALDLYTRSMARLQRRDAVLMRRLRAHEQEYANALTKAIRGAGGEAEPEEIEVDLEDVRGRADLLELAYAQENAALALYIEAAPRLNTDAPQALAASLSAGHAQHLVLLRRALGASVMDSVPDAFDVGELPPPERPEGESAAPPASGER
jgi:rubrerythrin